LLNYHCVFLRSHVPTSSKYSVELLKGINSAALLTGSICSYDSGIYSSYDELSGNKSRNRTEDSAIALENTDTALLSEESSLYSNRKSLDKSKKKLFALSNNKSYNLRTEKYSSRLKKLPKQEIQTVRKLPRNDLEVLMVRFPSVLINILKMLSSQELLVFSHINSEFRQFVHSSSALHGKITLLLQRQILTVNIIGKVRYFMNGNIKFYYWLYKIYIEILTYQIFYFRKIYIVHLRHFTRENPVIQWATTTIRLL